MNAGQHVDLILRHGNIYTANDRQPQAEAIAVRDRHIVFVGSNADTKQFEADRVIDLDGKTVLPGLTDSHCHIFGIGEREMSLNLEGSDTLEGFLARVKERGAKSEPGKWITGRGWIETFWKPPRFPTRQDLDRISPDNPLFLTRADGHAAIANTAALKIAGIDAKTPNPFGGEILRINGEPSGMLLDNAQDLVAKHVPPPSELEREQALMLGIDREIKLGWCEIQNAGSTKQDVDLIRKLYAAGKIKIRMINAVYGPGSDAEWFLNEGPTIDGYEHHFTQRTIKVIFDGALGSRGAALLKPYNDAPDTSGYLTQKPEELRPMFEKALRRGIQVETHAIGDRANRTILDLYEEAFKTLSNNGGANSREPGESASPARTGVAELRPPKIGDVRWRIEHAQIVDPADIPRFAKLGVIPSMQPSHAISDLFFAPARLGMNRLAGAYAWQSFLKSGSIICGGSDAPVERGEPMIEFYAAVARKPLPEHGLSVRAPSGVKLRSAKKEGGQNVRLAHRQDAYVPAQGEGWHPEQAVSREQALKMFTLWPAYAAFEEKDKGSIETGKLADFTVLSADIMRIPKAEILKARCEMTIIGGETVYDAIKN